MQFTIQAAKDDLSDLIERVKAGEDVVIADGKGPVARLVAIEQKRFTIGLLKGKIEGDGPDFFEPMAENELELWDGRT